MSLKRPTGALLSVGIGLWIAAPVAAVIALTLVASQITPSGTPEPTWVPVRASEGTLSRPVDIAMMWSRSEPIRAPGWSGTVQSIEVKPGDTLKTGTRIVTIDGTARIAGVTPEPFYRTISSGDAGADVAALHKLLAALELPSGSGDQASWVTMQGVAALSQLVGAESTAFDPAWIVFVPRSGLRVSSVTLTVATPAPTAGDEIIGIAAALTSATVVDAGSLDALVDAEAPAETVLTPEHVSSFSSGLVSGERLVVNETELLVDESGSLDAEGLVAVSSVVEAGVPLLRVNAVRDAGADELLIPSGSLYTDAHGSTCVMSRDGSGTTEAARVDIVSTQGDQTIVTGGTLSAQDEVAVGAEPTPC